MRQLSVSVSFPSDGLWGEDDREWKGCRERVNRGHIELSCLLQVLPTLKQYFLISCTTIKRIV